MFSLCHGSRHLTHILKVCIISICRHSTLNYKTVQPGTSFIELECGQASPDDLIKMESLVEKVLKFGCGLLPIGSHVRVPGPCQLIMFWKVIETSGVGASFKSVEEP